MRIRRTRGESWWFEIATTSDAPLAVDEVAVWVLPLDAPAEDVADMLTNLTDEERARPNATEPSRRSGNSFRHAHSCAGFSATILACRRSRCRSPTPAPASR